jgi:hypothetical protein
VQDFMVRDVLEGLTFALTVIFVAYSPVMRALGNRIMHGRMPAPGSTPLPDPRVDDVIEDNAILRRQLDEMQERVDFAERMLAQAKDRGLLGAPKGQG